MRIQLIAGTGVALALLVGTSTVSGAAAPAALDTNLIVNPDAEDGPSAPDLSEAASIPGWTRQGRFTVTAYGAGAGLPDEDTLLAPAMRGKSFFSGGPNNAASGASQEIDVFALASQIDSGKLVYILSGYLGGGPHSQSTALTADFLDSKRVALRDVVLGPVTAAGRSPGILCMLNRDTQGTVPAGTRRLVIKLSMLGTAGSYNDSTADNLFLMFTDKTPGVMVPAR